ncbi:MAG: response regulator [Acidobacteriota bacterium]
MPNPEVVMAAQKRVMVLDDEPIVGERLKPALEKEGFEVEVFTDSERAVQRLAESPFHVLVTDLKMRGPSGMDVLRYVKETAPSTAVIVITGYATIETHHEAEAWGAAKFVPKPFKIQEIARLVREAAGPS